MIEHRKPSPEALEQIPYALDRLREVGLDGAADLLERAPVAEDRLERAIQAMESVLRVEGDHWWIAGGHDDKYRDVIAEHRGEEPEATLARLGPLEYRGIVLSEPEQPRHITVSDPHRLLELHPQVREGIDRWIADPAPKLPGISLAVAPVDRGGTGPDLEIRAERRAEGRRWAGMFLVGEADIRLGRMPLAELAYRQMDGLHRRMIESLRDERDSRPAIHRLPIR